MGKSKKCNCSTASEQAINASTGICTCGDNCPGIGCTCGCTCCA